MSSTLRRTPVNDEITPDGQPPEAETRMRRALGLLPSAPRAVSRGSDGLVVEHRGDRHARPSINRVAVAEAALTEERHAREQLARQLRDAEAALHEAQTKRGHAELARDEALAALAAERTARAAAEEQLRQLMEAPPAPAAMQETPERASAEEAPLPVARKRGRPPGSVSRHKRAAAAPKTAEPDDQEEAVEWWVPGWKDRF